MLAAPRTHRHTILCVLPPHILNSISQNGTREQRAAALRTLSLDTTLRAFRATRRALAPTGAESHSWRVRAISERERCTVFFVCSRLSVARLPNSIGA